MPTVDFHGESLTLDTASRSSLPGKFVELPEGVVHYEIAGPLEGEAVVLVPGISVPYHVFDPTFRALVEVGLRVLRYDLYGRGYSDRPDVDYDLDLFDRQLDQLLSTLGLSGPANVIGLSMGGAIAATFADRHSDRVRRLVLIDPLASAPSVPLALKLLLVPGVGERLMDWLGDRMLVGGQLADFYRPEQYPDYADKYRPQMRYRDFKRAILSTLRSMPTWDIEGAFRRVGRREFPILLIWGRQDRTIPFDQHRRVQAMLPHVEFHAIDEAGHVPHYEQPEVVNPLLIEFLRKS